MLKISKFIDERNNELSMAECEIRSRCANRIMEELRKLIGKKVIIRYDKDGAPIRQQMDITDVSEASKLENYVPHSYQPQPWEYVADIHGSDGRTESLRSYATVEVIE